MNSKLVSGAEAFAYILSKEKVKYVFAYPGTSELALCDAVLKTPGVTLINGRGDKESAFMAAGGCMLRPSNAVAILHGARGLTNAIGALADVRRNEIGTTYFIGLPSSRSIRFLPPHGEFHLIENAGKFAKNYYEITSVANITDDKKTRERKARSFIQQVQMALQKSRELPIGPTLLGIPQNVSEQKWIPLSLLNKYSPKAPRIGTVDTVKLKKALSLIKNKKRIIILVDDFLFKNPRAKKQLAIFARAIQAPIFSVFYGRGPMLFEKPLAKTNRLYLGNYLPNNEIHKKEIDNADLIITLEDRNMYERVIGKLPTCPKIAITSNPQMTQKNEYLNKNDLVLIGDVYTYMKRVKSMSTSNNHIALNKKCAHFRKESQKVLDANPQFDYMRATLTDELARAISNVDKPVLVDDSQMFGGLINEGYEKFPNKLRVFGDHGAFIGGGLSMAAGLARCEKSVTVFTTLGDQSFTNALQGLISVVQEKVKIIFIVCNNGKSVSLLKQILSQDENAFETGTNRFLLNAPYDYTKLANSIGLTTFQITFNPLSRKPHEKNPSGQLKKIVTKALEIHGPVLIELKLPPDPEAWTGIWAVKGNEK